MRELLYDFRDTWRGLRRDRLYTAAITGTLALTLGASIAVFSIVNGVLLRPLSYPDPEALVSIREIVPGIAERYPTLPATMRHFDIWRDRATSFASMAAMDWRTSTLTGAGDAAQVVILRASGTLFEVLQIPTMLGRGLTRDDENRERPPVAVISEQLWRERLGGDPGIVGRLVTLNGAPFTIVGVIPRGYALPRLQPLAESGTVTTEFAAIVPFRISLANFDWMGQFNYGVVARLKPGVTLQQSRAEMNVLQGTVADIARRQTRAPAELRGWIMPLEETIVGPVRRGLLVMLGAVLLVLLVVCANVANLFLVRGTARTRELALRGALGASRAQVVRLLVVESLLLSIVGGALGVLTAWWSVRALLALSGDFLPRAA
ncbi:MAG: ABC transporter permease, partial [Vicinamibacterales bacterium]